MRIGFISREFPPFFGGGVGIYVLEMSRALARIGHEVHVFTVATDDRDHHADPPDIFVHRAKYDLPEPSDRWLAEDLIKANELLYGAESFHGAVTDFLRQHPLDIVEAPEVEGPGFFLLADPGWTVPTVVNCHSPMWMYQRANRQSPIRGQHFEQLCIAMADGVCAPSRYLAGQIEDELQLKRPMNVLPHPFSAHRFCESFTPPGKKTVLFVGRLEALKGVVELLSAAFMVLDKHPDTQFIFAGGDTMTAPGGGMMKQYLQSLIPAQWADRIRFAGKIPRDKLPPLYKSASFCALLSRFDNFPNVCLESMACGRGAVVGKNTGMPELMGDSCVPCNVGDIDNIAEVMTSLLDDPSRCNQLGQSGFHRVRENFDPVLCAKQRTVFYESVIAKCAGLSEFDRRISQVPPVCFLNSIPELSTMIRTMQPTSGPDHCVAFSPAIAKVIALFKTADKPVFIALYGAGKHSRKLLLQNALLLQNGIKVTAILDDDPDKHGKSILNIPILPPLEATTLDIGCVVLSSDFAEEALWQASAFLREAGMAVFRLYAPQKSKGAP